MQKKIYGIRVVATILDVLKTKDTKLTIICHRECSVVRCTCYPWDQGRDQYHIINYRWRAASERLGFLNVEGI
jgi:hypothetical protein